MKNELIKKQWEKFEDMVLPGAPVHQKLHMRDAFYAGAAVTLEIFLNINEAGYSKTQAKNILNSIIQENRDYADNAILDNLLESHMTEC